MSNNIGYFKFPRELLNSANWKSLSLEYRYIYTVILSNVAYEKTTQNDHGKIIEVKPGQMLVTYREIVRLCDHKDIDLPLVQRALKRFKDIGFSIQETIHIKTLITITEPIICKIWFELNDTRNDTQNDTRTIQERYTKEEVKKERKEEEQYISREALGKIVNGDFKNSLSNENTSPITKEKSNITNINRRIDSIEKETKSNKYEKTKTNYKQKLDPPSELAISLNTIFYESLENNVPTHRPISGMPQKRTEMARQFDQILKTYQESEIKKCINYGHSDDFWKSVIDSPKKLKRHIGKLLTQCEVKNEGVKGNFKQPTPCKNAIFKPNPRKFLDANAE